VGRHEHLHVHLGLTEADLQGLEEAREDGALPAGVQVRLGLVDEEDDGAGGDAAWALTRRRCSEMAQVNT
jgi:hypothetical protein